mgnify:CR=1 FL=1
MKLLKQEIIKIKNDISKNENIDTLCYSFY